MKVYPEFIIDKPFCEKEYCCKNISLRYLLEVKMCNNQDDVLCIMMNPSIADSHQSDDTINSILRLLKDKYIFGKLKVVNLYPIFKSQSNELSSIINELKITLGEDKYNSIMKTNFYKI
ncbi:DUF1643 domain-containing protein [Clostridium tyrobutyricum]|uniref:DUF1643 domain-containing protein n=1 Tax=Clostridium tyrobutyricum TaxID=1519 RepID=UPI001C39010A|nr:DUF1643 domain-containing protein [Clostridium tyrobutyricum]MBV4419813.1 DUF1643 domain-containing protein [Clostridium tyrobutyricum]